MNLASSHIRRRIITITTTALMAATLLSLSGFLGFADAAPKCKECGRDGGVGDGGRDGGKGGCRYNGFTYSHGDTVHFPNGTFMRCEDGKWMGYGIGFQG
jgi:hypothetical protein